MNHFSFEGFHQTKIRLCVMEHILRMTRVHIHGSKVQKEGGGIKDQNNRLSTRGLFVRLKKTWSSRVILRKTKLAV